MARRTGVTTNTPANLIVDAGAVYLNYGEVDERLLGATAGGSTFSVEQEFRNVEADGLPGAVNGLTRIIGVVATMTVNMLEYSIENLQIALPGAEVTPEAGGSPTYDSVRRTRNIQLSDFITNIALVGTVQNKAEPVVCLLYNALNTGNLELATEDDGEAVTELTFQGHFDLTDFDNEPWEIRYPRA